MATVADQTIPVTARQRTSLATLEQEAKAAQARLHLFLTAIAQSADVPEAVRVVGLTEDGLLVEWDEAEEAA